MFNTVVDASKLPLLLYIFVLANGVPQSHPSLTAAPLLPLEPDVPDEPLEPDEPEVPDEPLEPDVPE